MNEVIKLAIEKGGYKKDEITKNTVHKIDETGDLVYWTGKFGKEMRVMMREEAVILDPLFWQALGKALGWPDATHNAEYWKAAAHDYFNLILTV